MVQAFMERLQATAFALVVWGRDDEHKRLRAALTGAQRCAHE